MSIGPSITLRERRRTSRGGGVPLPPGPGFSLDRLAGFRRETMPWTMRAVARRWPGVAYLGVPGRHLYLVSDPELVKVVLEVMRDLAARGMTMVVVTHEIGFAREVGDSLVFMDGGVVVESGPPREVINNPQHERTKTFLSKVL